MPIFIDLLSSRDLGSAYSNKRCMDRVSMVALQEPATEISHQVNRYGLRQAYDQLEHIAI